MTDREAVAWFDRGASSYFTRHREPSDHLDDLLDALAPASRVLDLGCGPGRDADHMARRGHRVLGADAAPGMLAVARREFPHVEFREADMRGLELPAGSFDAIVAQFSLIFLASDQLDLVLARCARWLAPRGLLLVGAQAGESAEAGERDMFRLMPMEELVERLARAGLTAEKTWQRPPKPTERPYDKLHVLARRA